MITIDLHDYNIIKKCKKDTSTKSLSDYLKEYYLIHEVTIMDLYTNLLRTFLKVNNLNQIEDTFNRKLYNVYLNKRMIDKNNNSFDYNDLINVLFNNLVLLKICNKKKNGEYEDYYEVLVDDKLIPFTEVDKYLTKKEKKKQKKLQK